MLALARQKAELPVISRAAYRLLMLLPNGEHHHLSQLEELVQTDPSLTGKVLGAANSAAFHRAGARCCLTVREAIHRIGTTTAWEIAAQFALAGCFKTQPDARAVASALWTHALLVACQAKELAAASSISPQVSPEAAYVAGLLHDIGYLVMLSVAPGLSAPLQRGLVNGVANEDTFAAILGEDDVTNHEAFGYELLKHWGIPQPLPDALQYLHKPERWPWSSAATLSLCHVTFVADLVVRNEQRRDPQPLEAVAAEYAEEFGALRLDANALGAAVTRARRRAGEIQAMAESMVA